MIMSTQNQLFKVLLPSSPCILPLLRSKFRKAFPRRRLTTNNFSTQAITRQLSVEQEQNIIDLETKGHTIVNGLFSTEEIKKMQADYKGIRKTAMSIIDEEPAQPRVWEENGDVTTSQYWLRDDKVILQAGVGRYDLWRGFNTGFFASEALVNNPKLEPILKHCLVDNYGSYRGMILSDPGSSDQYFHRDTDPLENVGSKGKALMAVDDFYFTCLIPVTGDVTPENGPTEFLEGSHRHCSDEFEGLEEAEVCCPLGSAVLFNGKINHRGKGNRSEKDDRAVVYAVYHKEWYNDQFRKGVDQT
ncbi:hypothetical protein TrST_g10585 [Triparma strigata]|uniref:Phytanoyl-CoA dioxygenase n=1 Tax=Triparma strigata TaxID=1606541 RepID=A0A9W7DZS9_9STRA|nr:hypothetical protein TrST_g10585 [Triparma strigata]